MTRNFKIGIDQTMCIEGDQDMDKTIEVGQDMILIKEAAIGVLQEVVRGMGDQIIIEGETLEIKIMTEIGVGCTKDRTDTEGTVEALVTADQGQVQGWLQRDRIRCFECMEYNHFAGDCSTKQASREAEQIKQMFNMDEDQTLLQTPLMDTDQDKQTISPVETRDNLNL